MIARNRYITSLGIILGMTLCLAFLFPPDGRTENVIVVPRYPGNLPEVELKHPTIPKRGKQSTLPKIKQDIQPDSPGSAVEAPLSKPNLLDSIGTDKEVSENLQTTEREQLSSQGYFFVKGRLKGVGWAKLYLYDHKGGFFDLYNSDQNMNLLGTGYMDSNGEFRIGPIKYKNRWYYEGKDIILVMELESPYAVAYSEIYGTVRPFRYKILERQRVVPEGGEYSLGTINLNLKEDRYYPVRSFDRIVRRLQEQGSATEQKVRIEFVRDVSNPRYMEEIGYILMPYSGEGQSQPKQTNQ